MCAPFLAPAAIGAAAGPGTALGVAAPSIFSASSLGTAFSVISTAVSAIGQLQQSRADSAALQQQADIARFNAQVSENNAILARQAAEADADTIDRRRRIALAQQTASFAASGVVIDEGSTLEVLGDTAAEFELDRLNRLHQGDVESNSQRIQATLDRNNAQGLLSQSRSASRAGVGSALGTALGGAQSIARNLPRSRNPSSSVNAPITNSSLQGLSRSQQITLSGLPGSGF
tara:strand:- start:296 stop:991 length:696 start_codon:yes stop_codon:yes gene_type:complete